MGAILASGSNAALADGADQVDAFMNGLHHALYVAAAIAFAGAAVACLDRAQPCRVAGHRRASDTPSRYEPGVAGAAPCRRAALGDRRRRARRVRQRELCEARRRRRSRAQRAFPNRSSTVTSRRSESCGSRASTRPGAGFGRRSSRRAARPSRMRAPSRAPAPEKRSPWSSPLLPNLWLQGVTEAAEDEEIQRYVRSHVREVHDFVAEMMRGYQADGAMPADRDPDAEAWIFLAGGLLRSFADRLGGVARSSGIRRDRPRAAALALGLEIRTGCAAARTRSSRPRSRPTADASATPHLRPLPRRRSGSPTRSGRPRGRA